MNKRLISLLLVIVMICTLLPMAVLAEESVDTGYVAIVVYGKNLTRIIEQVEQNDGGVQAFKDAIDDSMEDLLAGETIPDCSFVLTNDVTGETYKMGKVEGSEASILKSIGIEPETEAEGILGKMQDIVSAMGEKVFESAGLGGLTKFTNGLYQTYRSEPVPLGKYTLTVGEINKDGYTLSKNTEQPESYSVEVTEKNKPHYTGTPKYIGAGNVSDLSNFVKENFKEILQGISAAQINQMLGLSENNVIGTSLKGIIDQASNSFESLKNKIDALFGGATNKLLDRIVAEIQKSPLSFRLVFPGVWLARQEPGFSFKSVNFGGEAVPGSEFIMIHREELEKVVKAMISAGKVSFEAALETLGDKESGASWEDINLLNKQIVTWDTESNEIALDYDQAKELLTSYITLLWNSAIPGISLMMSDELDLHLPAMLKATADENGIVRFERDNNITLVWGIDIITKLIKTVGEITADSGELINNIVAENSESKALIAVVDLANRIIQVTAGSDKYAEYLDKGAEVVKEQINQWVYPILQNDNIPAKLNSTAKYLVDLFGVEEGFLTDLVSILPTHAILTEKMPTGHYIMMQSAAPKGYLRNPVFYTISVVWDTSKPSVYDWVYVNVANIGIIGPYFAEDYYTFLRNNSLIKTGDTIISKLTGKESDVLARTITDTTMVPTTIAYFAGIIYNNMGGSAVYASQEALVTEMSKYLLSHGVNAQNLWIFANQVKDRAKAVVTSEITEDWYFYNIKENLHSNYADAAKAILNGKKEALTEKNLVSSSVTAIIDAKISIIDKVDTAITNATSKYVEAVKEATSNATKSIVSKATSTVKSLLSKLFKR